jgi:hypothetical protein
MARVYKLAGAPRRAIDEQAAQNHLLFKESDEVATLEPRVHHLLSTIRNPLSILGVFRLGLFLLGLPQPGHLATQHRIDTGSPDLEALRIGGYY